MVLVIMCVSCQLSTLFIFTKPYRQRAPYQIHHATGRFRRLPNITKICARGAKPIGRLGLVVPGFTIAYHSADLGRNLPCETFTNLYHRGEGDWIKPNTPSRVGQYRHSGCHMGSMVKGYRSRSPSEPLGVVARWVVGVTKKKFSRMVTVA